MASNIQGRGPLDTLSQSTDNTYQALQLMEFLIKNGSERVIDDARSHLSLLKMLRQFHYIDQNGKDQGINVRNRSKELTELLSDVEKIRSERKKARATKNKYGGVEGGLGLGGGGSMSSSGRYGGFGSESAGVGGSGYGAYSGGVYGDGGGFGGNTEEDYTESRSRSTGRERFEEYDEYDEGAVAASGRRKADVGRPSSSRRTAKKAEPPKPKEPEVDLFDFGDDSGPATAPLATSGGNGFAASGALQSGGADDDDFDDFQSATPVTQASAQPTLSAIPPPTSTSTTTSTTQFAAPQPRVAAGSSNFNNIFSTTSPAPSQAATPSVSTLASPALQQPRPTGYQAAQPNYFTSVSQPVQPQSGIASPSVASPTGGKPKAAGGDAFAALLAGTNIKKSNTPSNKGLTMADMAKQKASAGIWGTTGTPSPAPAQSQSSVQKSSGGGGALDDLLG